MSFRRRNKSIIVLAFLIILIIYPSISAGIVKKIGEEIQINTYTPDNQIEPWISPLSGGNFIVTWSSWGHQDGSCAGVFGQIFDISGNKLGNEFQINSNANENQWSPSVASFPNGNFVVVWDSVQDESAGSVYGQLYDKLGNKIGIEFKVNTYSEDWQIYPTVSTFPGGGFIVTWTSTYSGSRKMEIYGQLFDNSGNKLGNEFQINEFSDGDQRYQDVAVFSDSSFVVTWEDRERSGIFGQLYDETGSKVGDEFQVCTNVGAPSIAVLLNGDFVVTWCSSTYMGNIYGQLFNRFGNKLGSEFQISSDPLSSPKVPSVAALSNGGFVVTWYSYLAEQGVCVFGQLLDNSGKKSNSVFRVDTRADENGGNWDNPPQVAEIYDGRFIVNWKYAEKWINPSDSNYDVFGQIFEIQENSTMPWISLLLMDANERLISTRWDQLGYYQYFYNTEYSPCIAIPTPLDNTTGQSYIVGCTAVAVGQLINYYFQKGYKDGWLEVLLQNVHVYPRFGFLGNFIYKDCMHVGIATKEKYPVLINDWIGPNSEAYFLREFLWTVALGLDSHFSDDLTLVGDVYIGQGYTSYQEKIKTLLRDRFRFNPNITYTNKMARLDIQRDYIINSINMGQPVIVSMFCDAGGHVVLIDAYQVNSNGEFQVKINFGWGNRSNENNQWYPTNGAFVDPNSNYLWEEFIVFAHTTPINY